LPARPVFRAAVGAVDRGGGTGRPGAAGPAAAVPGHREGGHRRPRLSQREPGEERRMTSDERALIEAIRDDPDDSSVRLVYADWLEDQGRADHAELIRVQIALAKGRAARRPSINERRR